MYPAIRIAVSVQCPMIDKIIASMMHHDMIGPSPMLAS